MKAFHHGKFYHFSIFRWFDGAGKGAVVLERPMKTVFVVVIEEPLQNLVQMGFVENDHMIQALPTNRPDQSFDDRILPGRSWGDELLLDTHAVDSAHNLGAIDPIAVAQ